MSQTEYETTLLVRPDVGGDAIEATLDKVREVVSTGGGKLLAINHWGKKKLAYPIKKHARGVYVHTQYLGGAGLVAELERNLRITDNVIRFLTVQVAKDIDPTSREQKAYVRPQYDVEEPGSAEEQGEEFGEPVESDVAPEDEPLEEAVDKDVKGTEE